MHRVCPPVDDKHLIAMEHPVPDGLAKCFKRRWENLRVSMVVA